MKRDNINYTIVGVFVVGLFLVFMYTMYQITGRVGPTDHYVVIYQNVAGVKFGTPVLYEGYPVGQVETIEPVRAVDGMRYRVTFSVTEGWKIPDDSVARIVASGLLATMTIEIREGHSNVMLEPGAEISGREAVSMLAAVNEVAADFQELTRDSIRPLLDGLTYNIDRLTQEFLNIANEDVRPLLSAFRDADLASDLSSLVQKLDDSAEALKLILDDGNQEKISLTLDNIQSASANLDSLFLNFEETRAQLDDVLDGLHTVVHDNRDDLNTAVADLRRALEAVAGSMDTITHQLEGSTRNLNEFTRQIRANPGAILRSRPPEQEIPAREEQ
jgi:phospholipid/cholesterol/gamma-HCH transport system substrate-binding protein